MSETVEITKGGIKTIVPVGAYESVYKPKGWELTGAVVKNALQSELQDKRITDENRQNDYIKAKREREARHFNDGLFKGE